MSDLAVLVPDKTYEVVFREFFGRGGAQARLGCGPFAFAPQADLWVHPQRDPGVYSRGAAFLADLTSPNRHRHALILLDADWDGSPGAAAIRTRLQADLDATAWGAARARAIVIDPEIENWIWSPSPVLGQVIRWCDTVPPVAWLEQKGLWPQGAPKPPDPKRALEVTLDHTGKRWSSSIHGEVIAQASVKGCVDPAFRALATTLRAWFPPAVPPDPSGTP